MTFTEYVNSQDKFRVTGTLKVFFQGDQSLIDWASEYRGLMETYREIDLSSPKADTTIARFMR